MSLKKIFLFAVALLSVNFLFAFEKTKPGDFMSAKTNDFVLNKKLFTPELKVTTKKGKQSDAFSEGIIVVTAGYGFPNLGKSVLKAYQGYGGYKVSGVGPLSFKGEYGLSDKIGFGVSINYVSFAASWIENGTDSLGNSTIPYTYKFSRTSVSVLARLNIHFATSEKLDPYWGVGAGYRTGGYKFTSNDPSYTGSVTFPTIPVGFETTIGVRYYFTDNIGGYVEMGMAKALIQAGLSFKF